MKYGLELQFERLKEKNLKMQYGISPRGVLANDHGAGRQWKDNQRGKRIFYVGIHLIRFVIRTSRQMFFSRENPVQKLRVMQFMDKTIEVNEHVIDRLNGIYDQFLKHFFRKYN